MTSSRANTSTTTVAHGLPVDHPGVWRIEVGVRGSSVVLYSLTEPVIHRDDDTGHFTGLDYERVPPEYFPPGSLAGASEVIVGRWDDVATIVVRYLPTPGEAPKPAPVGRPQALTDEELYDLIYPHAERLASHHGVRTPPFAVGYSTSALAETVRMRPEIIGDNTRIRTLCARALAEARAAWEADGAHHAAALREAEALDPPAPPPPAWDYEEALGLTVGQGVMWFPQSGGVGDTGHITAITGTADDYHVEILTSKGKSITLDNVDPAVLRGGYLP